MVARGGGKSSPSPGCSLMGAHLPPDRIYLEGTYCKNMGVTAYHTLSHGFAHAAHIDGASTLPQALWRHQETSLGKEIKNRSLQYEVPGSQPLPKPMIVALVQQTDEVTKALRVSR